MLFRFIVSLVFFFSLFFPFISQASEDVLPAIIFTQIKIGDEKSVDNEFIEIYNQSEATIDISKWKLRKRSSPTSPNSSITTIDSCVFLPPKTHFLWANTKSAVYATSADKTTSASLAINNTFELVDQNDILQDSFVWDDDKHLSESAFRNILTLAWTFAPTVFPTSHEQVCQKIDPDKDPEPSSAPVPPTLQYPTTVRINEVLPAPSDTKEFIELYNFGTEDIDLRHWILRDASKTGHFIFPNTTILKARGYLTVFRDTFSFALNNINETVTLFDPNETLVDTLHYEKSYPDTSYGLDGTRWRWSAFITPDAVNQFGEQPNIVVTVPTVVYKNIATDFSTEKNDRWKYLWDFGDGHTSRLAQTSHTFSSTGEYIVTLTVFGDIESSTETFHLTVQKPPKTKVVITGIYPNPSGADTEGEWISIQNKGKKKVKLSQWSIATGSTAKKMTSHPLSTKITLKAGQEIRLTRKDASFSLLNTKGVVELRRADGKIASSVQYQTPSTRAEDISYTKTVQGWQWEIPESVQENIQKDSSETSQNTLETAGITNANMLIDIIDTLSMDEITLIQQQLEAKKALLRITDIASPADEKDPVSSISSLPPFPESAVHKQSFAPNTSPEKQVFLPDVPLLQAVSETLPASLTDTLNQSPQNQFNFLQTLNQTLGKVLYE